MMKVRTFVRRNTSPIFIGVAFAIAIPVFALSTPETPTAIQLILLFVGSYAPTVAALAVLELSQDEVGSQALRNRVWKWRLGLKWYLLVLLLPTVIWLLSSTILRPFDGHRTIQVSSLAYLPVIFVTNFGEEIGWRGFALPRLLTKMRPLPSSLLLGLIWGVFHVPLYWGRPVYMALNFILTLGLSILLTWLYLNTRGSVLLCALFLAVFNTWGQVYLCAEGAEMLLGTTTAVVWVFVGLLILRCGARLVRVPFPNDG
jgi:uncharacterized protein